MFRINNIGDKLTNWGLIKTETVSVRYLLYTDIAFKNVKFWSVIGY